MIRHAGQLVCATSDGTVLKRLWSLTVKHCYDIVGYSFLLDTVTVQVDVCLSLRQPLPTCLRTIDSAAKVCELFSGKRGRYRATVHIVA